jgi:hypothetical protein
MRLVVVKNSSDRMWSVIKNDVCTSINSGYAGKHASAGLYMQRKKEKNPVDVSTSKIFKDTEKFIVGRKVVTTGVDDIGKETQSDRTGDMNAGKKKKNMSQWEKIMTENLAKNVQDREMMDEAEFEHLKYNFPTIDQTFGDCSIITSDARNVFLPVDISVPKLKHLMRREV